MYKFSHSNSIHVRRSWKRVSIGMTVVHHTINAGWGEDYKDTSALDLSRLL